MKAPVYLLTCPHVRLEVTRLLVGFVVTVLAQKWSNNSSERDFFETFWANSSGRFGGLETFFTKNPFSFHLYLCSFSLSSSLFLIILSLLLSCFFSLLFSSLSSSLVFSHLSSFIFSFLLFSCLFFSSLVLSSLSVSLSFCLYLWCLGGVCVCVCLCVLRRVCIQNVPVCNTTTGTC